MDDARFDSLVRFFPMPRNRRGALAAVLGGALGGLRLVETGAKNKNRKRNKKRKKKCGCRGDRKLLSNGSCAKVCDDESDCALLCLCLPDPSVEGDRYCSPIPPDCMAIPLTCDTTAQCPLGQACIDVASECGGSNRCIPLCG